LADRSEGGITPGLAAVANAIVDALAEFGVEHIELPAAPERVWNAISRRTPLKGSSSAAAVSGVAARASMLASAGEHLLRYRLPVRD
jgi:hypothetical protein